MDGGMKTIGQVLAGSTVIALLRAVVDPEYGHWLAVIIFLVTGFVWITSVPTKPG